MSEYLEDQGLEFEPSEATHFTTDVEAHEDADAEVDMAVMRQAADNASALLSGIGHPHRLLILCLLTEGEKTVSQISKGLDIRQAATSQHLTRLRLDGLVKADRRGRYIYYTLANPVARDVLLVLHRAYCEDQASSQGCQVQ